MHPASLCSEFAEKMISVKITDKCNGNCYFCVNRDAYKVQEMNCPKIIEAALDLPSFQKVLITGGEPFLVFEETVEVLKGLRKHKNKLLLNTNGSLVSADKVERLNGLIDELYISIHNPDEKKNNTIFGFDKVSFENLKISLAEAEFMIVVNSTFNDSYETEEEKKSMLRNMIALTKFLGGKKLRLTELKNTENRPLASDFGFEDKDDKTLVKESCMEYFDADGVEVSVRRLCGFAKGKKAPSMGCHVSDTENGVMYCHRHPNSFNATCIADGNKDVEGSFYDDADSLTTFRVIYGNGESVSDWV